MRLLTVTLVELADHVTGEAEVRAGDRVPGARAVTRDLDWLTRALTRGEERGLIRLQAPVPAHHARAVAHTVLTLVIEMLVQCQIIDTQSRM